MYVHSRKPLLSVLVHTLSLAMIDGFISNVGLRPYVVGSPHVPMSPLWFAPTCTIDDQGHYCSAPPPVHGVSPSGVS
jgi:hypothetical protein